MQTLIFNGSPRKNGDTTSLLTLLTEGLSGEVLRVDAYDGLIKPCIDCRYCWEQPGCAIQDRMQEVYRFLETCDNVVIASPVYFSELTGPLLSVLSRLQALYCARAFREETLFGQDKRGLCILVGGGDGSLSKAEGTAKTLLRQMGARDLLPLIAFHDTNRRTAAKDLVLQQQLFAAAEALSTPR